MTPAGAAQPADHRRLTAQADRRRLGHHRPGRQPAVKQFGQMQKMMRQLQQGKMPSIEQLIRGM